MPDPIISIITPSYNQGRYLEENIHSIAGQGYQGVEHIIIDGGSTDNSVDIIRQHAGKLTYWISEPDQGQTDAINKGLAVAKGDIITWINSDDLLMPDALEKVAAYFDKHPEAGLIHGQTVLFSESSSRVHGGDKDDLPYRYLAGVPFPQPSSFFTRKALELAGGLDPELHYGMDYDLFVRIALQFDLLKVEDVFSKYRLHDESKTMTDSAAFARDWSKTFSKLLRSFSFTEDLIRQLDDLGIYVPGTDTFGVAKSFDRSFLERSFLYFLFYQVHFYYEALDMDKVRMITQHIKSIDPAFLKQTGLQPVYLRSRYFPRSVIALARKITR